MLGWLRWSTEGSPLLPPEMSRLLGCCQELPCRIVAPAAPEPLDDDVVGDPEDEVADAPEIPDAEAAAVHEPVGDGLVADLGVEVPREICGQHVKRVKGRNSGGWSYHDRIAVICPNVNHASCTKSRSLALDVDVFGVGAARIYLATWIEAADRMDQRAHKAFIPNRAQMREYLASQ